MSPKLCLSLINHNNAKFQFLEQRSLQSLLRGNRAVTSSYTNHKIKVQSLKDPTAAAASSANEGSGQGLLSRGCQLIRDKLFWSESPFFGPRQKKKPQTVQKHLKWASNDKDNDTDTL